MSGRFQHPVRVNFGEPGAARLVATPADASRLLSDVAWPVRGPRHRDASEACLKAIDGTRSAVDAENAFRDAAREAHVLEDNDNAR